MCLYTHIIKNLLEAPTTQYKYRKTTQGCISDSRTKDLSPSAKFQFFTTTSERAVIVMLRPGSSHPQPAMPDYVANTSGYRSRRLRGHTSNSYRGLGNSHKNLAHICSTATPAKACYLNCNTDSIGEGSVDSSEGSCCKSSCIGSISGSRPFCGWIYVCFY